MCFDSQLSPYLHGVCFTRWGLPICKNCPVVSFQDIWKTPSSAYWSETCCIFETKNTFALCHLYLFYTTLQVWCVNILIKKEIGTHLWQSSGHRHCTLVPVLYLTETLCQTCTVCPGKDRRRGLSITNITIIKFDFKKQNLDPHLQL